MLGRQLGGQWVNNSILCPRLLWVLGLGKVVEPFSQPQATKKFGCQLGVKKEVMKRGGMVQVCE